MSLEVNCWSQQGRLQRNLNGVLEWWIDGFSGLVMLPVSTSPPGNKWRHTDMASYTPLCFNLLLECCTLLHIQLKWDERRGKKVSWWGLCDLGIQFGSVVFFGKHCICTLLSENAHWQAALACSLCCKQRDMVPLIRFSNPSSRSTPPNDCN